MSKPVMYLIANKGLGMSSGKLAAQVAHAAVRSLLISQFRVVGTDIDESSLPGKWLKSGETKIVLEARDTEHLLAAREYIERRGFKTHLVIDEGRTEIPPHSSTVLGVEIVDKQEENVQFTFSDFKVYKEETPPKRRPGIYRVYEDGNPVRVPALDWMVKR